LVVLVEDLVELPRRVRLGGLVGRGLLRLLGQRCLGRRLLGSLRRRRALRLCRALATGLAACPLSLLLVELARDLDVVGTRPRLLRALLENRIRGALRVSDAEPGGLLGVRVDR